jgi:hypothetical protein
LLIASTNPTELCLETLAIGLDGAPKTNVVSGGVRVYHTVGGEAEDLALTPLWRVGSTSTWRFLWHPTSLAIGRYVAEFSLTDSDGVVAIGSEDIIIQTDTSVDVSLIRKCETNRLRLDEGTMQMVLYDDDGVTPILYFNCFDRNGNPNVEEVFDRKRVP